MKIPGAVKRDFSRPAARMREHQNSKKLFQGGAKMKSLKRILRISLLVSVAAFWSLTAAFAADVMTVLGPVPQRSSA